jgi:hypothetical protein
VTNGIGSDAFAIVALGGALVGLNASGRSPTSWTEARFAKMRSMPATGWDSATVPGAVSAWRCSIKSTQEKSAAGYSSTPVAKQKSSSPSKRRLAHASPALSSTPQLPRSRPTKSG